MGTNLRTEALCISTHLHLSTPPHSLTVKDSVGVNQRVVHVVLVALPIDGQGACLEALREPRLVALDAHCEAGERTKQ